mmetsp:Transcript_24453/g.40494  ORF Transcript_24453/g.40494 Transcript_24453/m.40494 type:complete len:234 (-) Transcript_24453:207-908(-)
MFSSCRSTMRAKEAMTMLSINMTTARPKTAISIKPTQSGAARFSCDAPSTSKGDTSKRAPPACAVHAKCSLIVSGSPLSVTPSRRVITFAILAENVASRGTLASCVRTLKAHVNANSTKSTTVPVPPRSFKSEKTVRILGPAFGKTNASSSRRNHPARVPHACSDWLAVSCTSLSEQPAPVAHVNAQPSSPSSKPKSRPSSKAKKPMRSACSAPPQNIVAMLSARQAVYPIRT